MDKDEYGASSIISEGDNKYKMFTILPFAAQPRTPSALQDSNEGTC